MGIQQQCETNGTATKADYALIERSEGARTVVLSAEGTNAWDSLRAEADKRMRSAERIPSPPEAALSPLGKGRNGVRSDNPSVNDADTSLYTWEALDSELEVQKAKYTDRFSREKLKSRIDSDFTYLHGMLKDPTDKRHIPEHLRAEVAAVLDCIKFETKQLDKIRDAGKEAQSPTAIKLAGISGLYEDIICKAWGVEKSGESKLLDEYLSEDLLELKESIPVDESGEFKRLQDMSTEELSLLK